MAEHYLMLKHLHITAAYLSLLFFILRAFWSLREAPILAGMTVGML
ncbi:SirB2 family protein [Halomonas vilamensis]|uniref:SirB2 family protein n=1 Tax=Vreelandella vilamensis TaxID=531309 RepID=A0ABU1H6G8_9GAMM|nr:SirB2 family protein [Halomonas vilamensis]MDR5899891.1 SirB2 family protein [Halomonas vilamensis]